MSTMQANKAHLIMRTIGCAALMCLALTGLSLSHTVPSANAITANNGFELGIVAANCQQVPTSFPFEGGDCVPADGAVIVATTETGVLLGTCVAKSTGDVDAKTATCSIVLPYGVVAIISEDTTTIAPGMNPRDNGQRWEIPSAPPDGVFGGPIFLNLPVDGKSTESSELHPTETPNAISSACTAPPVPTPSLDVAFNVPGYLLVYLDGAIFVEWSRQGDAITGTLYLAFEDEEPNGLLTTISYAFSGTIVEGRVRLSFEAFIFDAGSLSGQLRDDTLTLFFTGSDGNLSPAVLDGSTLAHYDQAVRSIRQRLDQRQSCLIEVEATASAVNERQNAVQKANERLDAALSRLQSDIEYLISLSDYSGTLESYAEEMTQILADDQAMRELVGTESLDCFELGDVEFALGDVEFDLGDIEFLDGDFEWEVSNTNDAIEAVEDDIAAVQSAWTELMNANAVSTAGDAQFWFGQSDVDQALADADQAIDSATEAINSTKAEIEEYRMQANEVYQSGVEFVEGLECED